MRTRFWGPAGRLRPGGSTDWSPLSWSLCPLTSPSPGLIKISPYSPDRPGVSLQGCEGHCPVGGDTASLVLHSGRPREPDRTGPCQRGGDYRTFPHSVCTDQPGESKVQTGQSLAYDHIGHSSQPRYGTHSPPGNINSVGPYNNLRR